MAKRKKAKKNPKRRSGGFFKALLILAAAGLLVWLWQEKKTPEPKRALKKEAQKSESKAEPKKAPETQAAESQPPPSRVEAPKLTGVFPKEAWLDDYLQTPAALEGSEKNELLVGLGLAPAGKDPEKILDPDKLRPQLLVVDKSNGRYVRREAFDFATGEPTEAGIRREDLRGIPRVTGGDLIDLSGDGRPEIVVKLDTHGAWTQSVGLLKWENGRIQWAKTSSPPSGEKIALWLSG